MDRARRTGGATVWALSVLLGGIFLAAGLGKLAGQDVLGFQAATMQGFPAWMRTLVGVFEVLGGVALLIPALAIYGALGLAVLMVPAAITQAVSEQPGVYVPVIVLILLLIVAWQRDAITMRGLYRGIAGPRGPVVREGVIAGVIGATVVAVWFFIVDIVAGHPLFTPTALGQALVSVLRLAPLTAPPAAYIVAYTVFHYLAFIVVGIVAADFFAWAGREPALLFGFIILFVAFEVGFYGFVALLQQASALGGLAWPQVMVGNLLSAAVMGTYIWRAHPKLHQQFAHVFD